MGRVGRIQLQPKIVATICAQFGVWVKENPDFTANSEVIICDEAVGTGVNMRYKHMQPATLHDEGDTGFGSPVQRVPSLCSSL